MREKWLNGWHRNGNVVLVGNAIHCAGCGRFQGITTVAVSADDKIPERADPNWPFDEANCPVHNRPTWTDDPVDKLTERAMAYKKRP